MNAFFKHNQLMVAPPVKRAAYSDRTAWIMAELSRLVYERLPNEQELEELMNRLVTAIKCDAKKSELLSIISETAASLNETQESHTEIILKRNQYELVKSYSVGGTEAMIVKIPPNPEFGFAGMFVIVFRGTEPNSIADLKSDIKANLVDAPDGGRVHNGFLKAYEKVADLLNEDIKKADGLPVYITGHSLGGALALVATRYLGSDSVGATYTFGGPRVGDDNFFKKIKTPVYRVVNAADGVARLPFGAGMSIFLSVIRLIPLNGTKWISEMIRKHFEGFTHYGNLVMLSASSEPDKVQVYMSPSIFKSGLQIVVPRMVATMGKAALADHSMTGYCQKLGAYALKRIS
ncbi:lipase family protein [Maridesulfovibrio sp.]|uniref:lipase family protein n=1 Tax=Maridesulfovibrio sp. TaxID=2795000 RepID=UPI002A18B15A|nr:lipase family protein [Maridesulfovibrio sp.]